MKNSRSLDDLHPAARRRFMNFLDACSTDAWMLANGITVILTSTLRDNEAQAALYDQGRTKPGRIVTRARPGQSWHNWSLAGDVLPLRHGKAVWGTSGDGIDDNPDDDDKDDLEVWQRVGEIGKRCGLEWAGDWPSFKEFPHFQFTGGLSLADLQVGRSLSVSA